MVRVSVLNDALKSMVQCKEKGEKDILESLSTFDDHRARKIVVELNGRLNKCGVISPRFDKGWTARLLPSRQKDQI